MNAMDTGGDASESLFAESNGALAITREQVTESGQPVETAVQRMGVRIGELGLLFSANDGREVMTPPTVSRVPNTVSWLQGMANVRGDLVPVIDIAAALDVQRQSGVPTYLLSFGHGETSIGLLIDGLPRLFSLSANELTTDMPELPALLKDSVIGVFVHAGRHWLEVDLDILFDTLAQHIAR